MRSDYTRNTMRERLLELAPLRRFAWICVLPALACLAAAAVHAATCPPNSGVSTSPTSNFTVNADGTVNHTTTGLMWKRCNEGSSGAACEIGTPTRLVWIEALLAARNTTFRGYDDWRLPNKHELESLVDDTCHTPAINDTVFPNAASEGTWTSTTSALFPPFAWTVDFYNGSTGTSGKYGYFAFRLVRGGRQFDTLAKCDLDLNGDGQIDADTDGVLLLRYLLGFRGTGLVTGIPISASRGDADGVENYIGLLSKYDVFGRPVPNPVGHLDGLVLVRLMLRVSNAGLLTGVALPVGATNADAAAVRTAVNLKCGTFF